jgi:predicted RNase H-like nuclease (RuvC/YqgF family)
MKAKPRRGKTPRRKRRATRKSARTKRPAKKARRVRKSAPLGRRAVEALEKEAHRLLRARSRLERRLTAAVQEIGTLRNFELRVQILERQVRDRDEEISRLRQELGERSGGAAIVSSQR